MNRLNMKKFTDIFSLLNFLCRKLLPAANYIYSMESNEGRLADRKCDALRARSDRKEFGNHGGEERDEAGVHLHPRPVLGHEGEVRLLLAKKPQE